MLELLLGHKQYFCVLNKFSMKSFFFFLTCYFLPLAKHLVVWGNPRVFLKIWKSSKTSNRGDDVDCWATFQSFRHIWDPQAARWWRSLPKQDLCPGLIPGLGRSPGEGNGIPPQCSCLESPRDRGSWWVLWGCEGLDTAEREFTSKPQVGLEEIGLFGNKMNQKMMPSHQGSYHSVPITIKHLHFLCVSWKFSIHFTRNKTPKLLKCLNFTFNSDYHLKIHSNPRKYLILLYVVDFREI